MKKTIYTGLKAEFLKNKGTLTYWFTAASSMLIPFVMFLILLFKHQRFIPAAGQNIWDNFFWTNLDAVANLFFPFFIILTVALNLNIEHKENSWKKLLLLPVSRTRIYAHKVIFILLQIMCALLIFLLSILIFGYILGFIHPELKFVQHSPSFFLYLELLGRLFISILGILGIQYIVSLFVKNITLPLSIGIFSTIVALIITLAWKYAIYFPYSGSIIFNYHRKGKMNIEDWFGFTVSDLTSVVVFIICMVVGAYFFRRKEMK